MESHVNRMADENNPDWDENFNPTKGYFGATGDRFDMPEFQRIDAPVHPKAVALHSHWLACRPNGGLPSRGSFGFEVVHGLGLMGAFFVIEPTEIDDDWRYRLLGSGIVWLFGNDVTGLPFRRHMAREEAEACIALSNEVAESGTPAFLFARFVSGGHSGTLETMSLPVTAPDGNGVWLVGCSLSVRTGVTE
jgi:hypothetical protein